MSREQAGWIEGPSGRLFGITHAPQRDLVHKTCVIMLNSGQLTRVGPHRIYVRAARRWAALGLSVLRVDLAGIGDSQAENPEIHYDNHSVHEVDAVVRHARDRLDAERIVLHGLCAGARAALKGAAANRHVSGVLAWSCPIFCGGAGMPSSPEGDLQQTRSSRARETRAELAAAIRDRRVLTRTWWAKRIQNLRADSLLLASALWPTKPVDGARGSFIDAAHEYLESGRGGLFVYGGLDRIALAEFQEQFNGIPEDREAPVHYAVVPGGTHTFASVASQDSVIELSGAWLAERFGTLADKEKSVAAEHEAGDLEPT